MWAAATTAASTGRSAAGVGGTEEPAAAYADKIRNLLEKCRGRYAWETALAACDRREFRDGVLLLLAHAGLSRLAVERVVSSGDVSDLARVCRRFEGKDPQVWVHSLQALSTMQQIPEDTLGEVLEAIERDGLLPPLMVLQTLSACSTVTLGSVKGFFTRHLEKEIAQIAEDRRITQQYRQATEEMRADIFRLKTRAQLFQARNCTACGQPLDLPTVHFHCTHQGQPASFHKRCLGDNETECPLCAPDNARLRLAAASTPSSSSLSEAFFKQLQGVKPGESRFDTIAEYFGRGLLT
mmetsp:Transcript_33345/g.88528  ORF Transcript_33345/g.88528 Transcript_33345/m.88528 type:complete len:296 (-) Transcript_33345:76-963(-)